MKRHVLTFLSGAAIVGLFSFKMTYEPRNNTAEVEQLEGVYIFTDCKPVKEYKYLGTVKNSGGGGFANPQYEAVRARLLKEAKKEYPEMNGIIIYPNNGQADKADAIKF